MNVNVKAGSAERIVPTTCNSHCAGACPLKVHVKDGVITRIETDDELRACLNGRAYRQRVYAPDRLLHPMKRVGERGKGQFVPISWDEALDTVADNIKRIRQTYGPAAVLLFYSIGDNHHLHNPGLTENLLAKSGGYSGTWGCASCEGGTFASYMSYGASSRGNSREDLLNSKFIILWGWNPVHTMNRGNNNFFLAKAREAGTRIVAVDPRYTDSAAVYAERWIPIRPGTDAAMLIAMAHVIIKEKLLDRAFLDKYTVGFDKYADYVLGKEDGVPKTPEWAEKITGVPAATTANLAREYATIKPAALLDGFAPGRTAYGEEFHRAAIALAAMTGNIGISGGAAPGDPASGSYTPALQHFGPRAYERFAGNDNPVDAVPQRKDALWYKKLKAATYYWGGPGTARVNRHFIADAILKGKRGGYPADYHMLYLANCNYVNQYGNINKIIKALMKLDFIVVQEQFMTATAKFADILLPDNTYMERNDVSQSGVGMFYGYCNKAIEPRGESKSHFEIASALAARLDVKDFADGKSEEQWLQEIVAQSKIVPDYAKFKEEGLHKVRLSKPFICFEKQISDPAHNPFPTPSGKIEIFSKELADLANPMLPAIPKYVQTWESLNDPLAKKFPLQLITIHTRRRAHSQYDNIPWLRELYPQVVSISAADASARGIKDGEKVMVFNDRGKMIIPANVTERIMPGVVELPQGAWYAPDEDGIDRGGCPNVLTRDGVEPGASFPSNTTLVQVKKA